MTRPALPAVLVESLGIDGAYVERNGSRYRVQRRDGGDVERDGTSSPPMR